MNGCLETGILQAYLDGELGAADRRGAESHLATCGSCASRLESMRTLALRVDGLLSALLEAPVAGAPIRVVGSGWGVWAAIAAALIAAVTLGAILTRHPSKPGERPEPRHVQRAVVAESAAIERAPAMQTHFVARKHVVRPVQREYFIRLDDSPEPIRIGMIAQVKLPLSLFDPSEPVNSSRVVPAEVILGEDGQPRAIRFLQ